MTLLDIEIGCSVKWKCSGQNIAADLPSSYQPFLPGFNLGSAVKYQGLQSFAWHLFLESKVLSVYFNSMKWRWSLRINSDMRLNFLFNMPKQGDVHDLYPQKILEKRDAEALHWIRCASRSFWSLLRICESCRPRANSLLMWIAR